MDIIKLAGVSKSYGSGMPVLHGLSLRVAAGESVAVVGPSGCGKSTLLNLIGGLDRPDAGTLEVCGTAPATLSGRELARFRCRNVGFVFQLHHLLPQYSALENALVPTLAPWGKRDGAAERARSLFARVGLADRLDSRPADLSGGERQRVAVVRALMNQPRIVLADEPTGSLSHDGAIALSNLLLELSRAEGMTLVTVTHSPQVAALMDRTLQLLEGKLQ